MSLVTKITDLAVAVADQINLLPKGDLLFLSGRWYCYADLRWVTDSDDNYGPNYYQFLENCGTGVDPIIEWEHKGVFIPAGRKIKKIDFVGRGTNAEIEDLEILICLKHPNPVTRWETGFDNDAEMDKITLFRGLFVDNITGYAGDMLDGHKMSIDINHTLAQDSFLSIYLKPVGPITVTRYVQSAFSYELA